MQGVRGIGGFAAVIAAQLLITAPALAAPPSNDDFADRTALPAGAPSTMTGTNAEATFEVGEPEHPSDPGGRSVWFTWEADVDEAVRIDTCTTNFDTLLAVYTGTALNDLELQRSSDDGDCPNLGSSLNFAATSGTTYAIAVDGFDGDTGTFDLDISETDATLEVEKDVSMIEGDVGSSNAVFDVILTGPLPDEVTVDYETAADGSADAGTDYTADEGTLTFAPMDRRETVSIPVSGDTVPEPDEIFFFDILDSSGPEIGTSFGVATIVNDDGPVPSFSIDDVSVAEGNSGTSNAAFTVSLANPPPGQTLMIDYGSSGDSAQTNVDFDDVFGTLTFGPGESQKQILVPIRGDTNVEANEFFFMDIFDTNNAEISDDFGTGTITNDDESAGPPATDIPPQTITPPVTPPTPTSVCTVPQLKGEKLVGAKQLLAAGGCTLGGVKKKKVRKGKSGIVLKQSPGFGAVRPGGSPVDVTVSKRKRKK